MYKGVKFQQLLVELYIKLISMQVDPTHNAENLYIDKKYIHTNISFKMSRQVNMHARIFSHIKH